MHKSLNAITALLLCANIAAGAQNSANETTPTSKKVKPTDASGIILASRVMSNYQDKEANTQSIQTLNNPWETSFLITKVGIDPVAIALPLITLAAACGGTVLFRDQNDNLAKILALATTLGGVAWLSNKAFNRVAVNMDATCDKHWIKSARASDGIKLRKIDGTWKVHSRTTEELQQLPDQEAQQLAEAIIANHNPDVKDEDLYTSEIFQKLVSDFKSRC